MTLKQDIYPVMIRLKLNSKGIPEDCDGICTTQDGCIVISIRTYPDVAKTIGILSHEMIHCLSCVNNYIGAELSEEAQAYLAQRLMQQAVAKIIKRKSYK